MMTVVDRVLMLTVLLSEPYTWNSLDTSSLLSLLHFCHGTRFFCRIEHRIKYSR